MKRSYFHRTSSQRDRTRVITAAIERRQKLRLNKPFNPQHKHETKNEK